jgi:hypothetical protein
MIAIFDLNQAQHRRGDSQIARTFATATIATKLHRGSRNTPATTVSGSPMTGTQLNKSDHRP